jgi:hypothetical protein
MALSGGIVLEEAVDLSSDRLLMMMTGCGPVVWQITDDDGHSYQTVLPVHSAYLHRNCYRQVSSNVIMCKAESNQVLQCKALPRLLGFIIFLRRIFIAYSIIFHRTFITSLVVVTWHAVFCLCGRKEIFNVGLTNFRFKRVIVISYSSVLAASFITKYKSWSTDICIVLLHSIASSNSYTSLPTAQTEESTTNHLLFTAYHSTG